VIGRRFGYRKRIRGFFIVSSRLILSCTTIFLVREILPTSKYIEVSFIDLICVDLFHLILKQMLKETEDRGRKKEARIIDEIPEEVAYGLSLLGGITGLFARLPSDEELNRRVSVHKALADPSRLKILHLLAAQPLCVCVIKHCLRMADSKISYHLHVLKDAGLIEGRQEKNWIIYRISDAGKTYLDAENSESKD
jgi:DNA-binding transcriptional ArsR family regulator